jgi:hypothetical protein
VSRLSFRAWSAVLLVAGAALGTAVDRVPSRPPVRAGEYWVLSGDFHVHAFPGDGALAPWVLRDEAARAGLDVIAVTNHNQTFTGRLAEWVSRDGDGPLMLAGQEITNPQYHMIAAGIDHTVDADQPAVGAMADLHAQGGVAIAAHPSRRFHGYDEEPAVAALDGAEVAHADIHFDAAFRSDMDAFFSRARGVNANIAAIGSSDFHAMPPPLGLSRTYLFVRERTKAGVLDAIRNGWTLAVDRDGRLQGHPALIQLIGDVRLAGRVDTHPAWRRLSMTLAWLGATGLVVLPSTRRRRRLSG